MAIWPPVTASDYYDRNPSLEHRAGDVWLDLPSLGNLPIPFYTGIIVTPPCDLQGRKTCSLTYLPVVPVRCAFHTFPLLTELCRTFNGQLNFLRLQRFEIDLKNFELPDETSIARINDACTSILRKDSTGDKEKKAVSRVLAGLKVFKLALKGDLSSAQSQTVRQLLAGEFERLAEKIVRNGFRSDVHFLPSDEQPAEWSGMPEHSVILFRHAASIPVRILDGAQDVAIANWPTEVERLSLLGSERANFALRRPSKRLTVKPRYFADIHTRYISMHVRLGSPDFAEGTVSKYAREIEGV